MAVAHISATDVSNLKIQTQGYKYCKRLPAIATCNWQHWQSVGDHCKAMVTKGRRPGNQRLCCISRMPEQKWDNACFHSECCNGNGTQQYSEPVAGDEVRVQCRIFSWISAASQRCARPLGSRAAACTALGITWQAPVSCPRTMDC